MAAGSSRGGRALGGTESRFRAHGRQAVRARAVVTYAAGGWRQEVAVENIGLGGAGLVVDGATLSPGDSVTVTFQGALPSPGSAAPLVLPGRVAWIAPPTNTSARRAVGVAFEHASPDAAYALYQILLAYDPSA
jgi:PilZ domain-containing protein